MKSKKDISDLIRDNQHKLDERPNPRAWKKLEDRLDQHEGKSKGNGRILLFRRLAMAAAVVTMVAVISIINTQSSSKEMAKAEANISPQDQFAQGLEPVYSKENKNLRQVIEIQRKLKDRYANPIQEGMQTKKLKASNKIRSNRTEHFSSTSNGNVEIVFNEKPSEDIGTQDDDVASNISMTFDASETEDVEMVEETTVNLDGKMAEAETAPIAVPAPPPVMADAIPSKPEMTQINKRKKKAQGNFSKVKTRDFGIQNLSWLAGDWVASDQSLNILFLNDTDLVSLDFKIKEIGNELFFIDSDNSTFELINNTKTTYTFEQKNKDQIILEKIDNNQFSKTLIKFNSGTKLVKIYKKK